MQTMIKTYCDICGKKINMKDDGVTVSFRTDSIHNHNLVYEDKQLCVTCTQKVKAFIRNSAVKQ